MQRLAPWLALAGQLAVLAVLVRLFAPGSPPHTELGHPAVSLRWDEPPDLSGIEAARLGDVAGVRLGGGANYSPPGLSPQTLESAFTISLELQLDEAPSSALPLLSRWDQQDGARSFMLGIRKGGRPFFVISGNGRKDKDAYREIRGRKSLPLGKPVHVVATFEPDERMLLLVDGVVVARAEGEEKVPSGAFPSREPILLGSDYKGPRWTSGTFRDLSGIYGPVEIFARAFEEDELKAASASLGYPAKGEAPPTKSRGRSE